MIKFKKSYDTFYQFLEKALELHAEMKIEKQFKASEGWLSHWKKKF